MAQLKKADLINKLVEEYGYEKDDLKLLTNAKLQAMFKQEELDAKELESQATRVASKATKIKDDELISIMSGVEGTFIHRSLATGRMWRFEKFGQIDKMPFSELLTLRNTSNEVFKGGYIVILDKVIQDEFGLTSLYENILTPENIGEIFTKSIEEMEKIIDSLPEGMKATLVIKARDMYNSRELDSASKIDFLQKKFDFSFADNAPLSDIV